MRVASVTLVAAAECTGSKTLQPNSVVVIVHCASSDNVYVTDIVRLEDSDYVIEILPLLFPEELIRF